MLHFTGECPGVLHFTWGGGGGGGGGANVFKSLLKV